MYVHCSCAQMSCCCPLLVSHWIDRPPEDCIQSSGGSSGPLTLSAHPSHNTNQCIIVVISLSLCQYSRLSVHQFASPSGRPQPLLSTLPAGVSTSALPALSSALQCRALDCGSCSTLIRCFALLCFALLCFALQCGTMLCSAFQCMLCFAFLCFAFLRNAVQCFALLCSALLCHAFQCSALLCFKQPLTYCTLQLCRAAMHCNFAAV